MGPMGSSNLSQEAHSVSLRFGKGSTTKSWSTHRLHSSSFLGLGFRVLGWDYLIGF